MTDKQELINVFLGTPGALMTGDFTLACGAKSPYYVNARKVLLMDDGLKAACACIKGLVTEKFYQVGGDGFGAAPLVCGLLALSTDVLDGFLVRKEPKEHGTGSLIEGTCIDGPTLIVEDVTTTGNSALKAVKTAQANHATVVAVVSIVDRSEGKALQLFREEGIPFYSVLTTNDLFSGSRLCC